ncbi:MAG: DUF4214 domain-containing protein [Oxalobacteraceae bacterium]|nr:DUF4214 domain-containing protein [Oxalobacteraceae bacterium]
MLRKFFSKDASDFTDLVSLVYRAALHREPDAGGLAMYAAQLASGQLDAAGLLQALIESDEYAALARHRASEALTTGAAAPLNLPAPVSALSARLAACESIIWADYLAAWRQVFDNPSHPLIIGQREYGVTHQRRFFETLNALAILGAGSSGARLLEFGASDFSVLYRRFFKDATLAIADRPVPDDYIGFTADVAQGKLGAADFFTIDLQAPAQFDALAASMPRFSHILFCEVLEHLVVNPVEVIRFLMSLLREEGVLYLTTPNFFRRENVEKMMRRVNPQEVYPAGDGNWDAHFHHREFDMRELLSFATEAGGELRACYFSACWDTPNEASHQDETSGNLVLVLARK